MCRRYYLSGVCGVDAGWPAGWRRWWRARRNKQAARARAPSDFGARQSNSSRESRVELLGCWAVGCWPLAAGCRLPTAGLESSSDSAIQTKPHAHSPVTLVKSPASRQTAGRRLELASLFVRNELSARPPAGGGAGARRVPRPHWSGSCACLPPIWKAAPATTTRLARRWAKNNVTPQEASRAPVMVFARAPAPAAPAQMGCLRFGRPARSRSARGAQLFSAPPPQIIIIIIIFTWPARAARPEVSN